MSHFLLSESAPRSMAVRRTSPPEHATATYSVVAEYGWAEKILCPDCYRDDANSIAVILASHFGIPVTTVEPADRFR